MNLDRATVDVIIPTYNSQEFLLEALNSCFIQTHPVNEVIIVDDGSSDQSAAKAIDAGASGGKLLGAGAGGFILFYVEDNKKNKFLKAFNIKNEDTETERILRTYMSSAKPNFKNNDKEKLIQILQNRVNILKNSIEVSPYYLKNVKFKRSYTEIQKIIDKYYNIF